MFLWSIKLCLVGTALCLSQAEAHKACNHGFSKRTNGTNGGDRHEILNSQSLFIRPANAPVAPLVKATATHGLIDTNTTTVVDVATTATDIVSDSVDSTVLILVRDATSAHSTYSGLNDRGIPYQVINVPQNGITLPPLNSSTTHGNYGLIVVMGEVSYNYGASGYASALKADQWQQLYIRYPSVFAWFGSTSIQGLILVQRLPEVVAMANSLKTGSAAGASTTGLYHYPATIANKTIATEFLQYAAAANASDKQTTVSTAGVINTFGGRQQMVFFLPFATDWLYTSVLPQHSWIHWGTRGLYAGYRRLMLNTQIDDMFLDTPMFDTQVSFRTAVTDVNHHISVMTTGALSARS